MQTQEPAKQVRRAGSLRRDHQPQNYSKPVRAAQFSPSPIRKSSQGSRAGAPSTTSFSTKLASSTAKQFAVVQQAMPMPLAPTSAKQSRACPSRGSSGPPLGDQLPKDADKENTPGPIFTNRANPDISAKDGLQNSVIAPQQQLLQSKKETPTSNL